jgi:hypothetical protein
MKTFRLLLIAAGLLASAAAQATVRISIDLSAQRLAVTRDGATVVWKISSGRPGYETPTGRYSVMRLEADHYSDEYDQAPMPYAIFFSPRGLAIHGSFERGLGSPRSHGCVRLAVGNAQKLFEWVEREGATIEIVGETRGGGRIAREEPPGVERVERPRPARRTRPVEPDYPEYAPEQAYRYY